MLNVDQFEEMDKNLNGFKRRKKINVSEELLDHVSELLKKEKGIDLSELSPEKKNSYFLFLVEFLLTKDIPNYSNKSYEVLKLKWEKRDQEEKERAAIRKANLAENDIYEDNDITIADLDRAGHIPDMDTEEEDEELMKMYKLK